MRALIVSAFFDISRGGWKNLKRTTEDYVGAYRDYTALLPADKYLVASEQLRGVVERLVDYFDAAEFEAMPAYRYVAPTRAIMESPAWKANFTAQDDIEHVEHLFPEYNALMLMKWDALERAVSATPGQYTHYVWADFGLGRRDSPTPVLPKPSGFKPIERDKIVISAQRGNGLRNGDVAQLREHVFKFREQVGGSFFIVPADLVAEFCRMVRESYEELLSMQLTTDEQLVIDMCVAKRPDMFHLSYHPIGLTKFHHQHNIIHGRDGREPLYFSHPRAERALRGWFKRFAKWNIGL